MAKLAREQLSRFHFVSELGVNVAGGMCGVVSVGVIGTWGVVIGWSCVDVRLYSKENDKSVSSQRGVRGSVHCVRAGSGWGHCVRARALNRVARECDRKSIMPVRACANGTRIVSECN